MESDGGQAFPRPLSKLSSEEISSDQDGMSLRDWFAGQALSGMVSGGWMPGDESQCARRLWKLADAMLAEREKGHTDGPTD